MTQDFKDKLLQYFTGNFQEGTTPYQYYQSNMETNINNLYTYLSGQIGNQYTGEFEVTGVFQAKTPNDININIHVLYGTAVGSTLHTYNFGFIVLIDDEFNVLELITEYSSGTVIGELSVLNVDEEGYIYGVETNYNDTQKRFIMLNNVAIKLPSEANYQAKIRRTYNLPAGINDYYINQIRKEIGGAKYLMAGITYINYVATPVAVELEIVVGASNNWTTYSYNDPYTLTGTTTLDLFANWSGSNLYFEIIGRDGNKLCRFFSNNGEINYNGVDTLSANTFSITAKINTGQEIIAGIIESDYSTYMKHIINIYEPGGAPGTTIYQKQGSYFGTTTASMNEIQINGLDIYYTEAIQQSASDYNFEVGRIIIDNSNYYLRELFNITASCDARYHYNWLFVSKENNLYTWYLQVEDEAYIVKEIFNLNDYLDGGIDNKKFFIPKSANLYNSSDLIFSKNLYNLQVNDNITTATVEIPNMNLNNISITNEDLIGSTYQNLVEANVEFTKNQYETVDVNFINTLNIYNKNNETITETEGSIRLNDSISQTIDYSNARMTKYRINYEDETTSINSNIWYPVTNFYRTNLSISVSKAISSIDFISEDEQTTYTTIYPVLEVGKDYIIRQDVYIAPKGTPEQVYYNTDEVYYNTEEIYY